MPPDCQNSAGVHGILARLLINEAINCVDWEIFSKVQTLSRFAHKLLGRTDHLASVHSMSA